MPCKPVRARLLLKRGKAVARWSKLGMFYIQLKYPEQPSIQPLAIGIDAGSKFEGFSVVGKKDTVLNIMSEAVDWIKGALKQRRQMRRARRYRKARRRECRFSNRLSGKNWVPPSTKARWDAKLRIVKQLVKILPLPCAVVEDVAAETRKNQPGWNRNFSPLEIGKKYFYGELTRMGLALITKTGRETKELRKGFRLEKVEDKSKPLFESHAVDAWCLAASVTGASKPTTRRLYYVIPLRFHRRQLQRFEPEKGGVRKRYGGTISSGLKRGTLVKHVKHGLCYLGGVLRGRFSLHDLKTGRRLTQIAKREDFKILTRIVFRTQFLPALSGWVSLGA
jgi:hypothetical protein